MVRNAEFRIPEYFVFGENRSPLVQATATVGIACDFRLFVVFSGFICDPFVSGLLKSGKNGEIVFFFIPSN